MGMSTPCLKPELFGLIYLILESILEVFTLKAEYRTMSGDFIFILENSSFLISQLSKIFTESSYGLTEYTRLTNREQGFRARRPGS
jgi:hypothetical protein